MKSEWEPSLIIKNDSSACVDILVKSKFSSIVIDMLINNEMICNRDKAANKYPLTFMIDAAVSIAIY